MSSPSRVGVYVGSILFCTWMSVFPWRAKKSELQRGGCSSNSACSVMAVVISVVLPPAAVVDVVVVVLVEMLVEALFNGFF
ncbi:hypothetical protein F0562_016622 [Nyssa sinensis]|uniref:Uncharacterized protein n=1 Tax=Nyssa sinensis TaxID=561372 RepID=A0A5J4ZEC4_9ASTE|nr:hypothetical protein F0562_016622 [Nyssa sinensis]